MKTLEPDKMLNDGVMFGYLSLLSATAHPNKLLITDFNFIRKIELCGVSLSLPTLKSKRILESEKVIFPVFREPMHWAILYFNVKNNSIEYFDSLGLD